MLRIRSAARRSIAAGSTLAVAAALLAAVTASSAEAAPKKGSAVWDSTSYVAGYGVLAVHGKVPGRGKRKVELQVKTKGGWETLTSKRSKKNGSYALASPLDWYGSHKVRVFSAGRPAFVKTKKATISPGYAPVGNPKDYALLDGSVTKTWRFNPCQTVKYKVNADDTGPVGITLAQRAMAQISAATGIKVKYTGTTSIIPAAPSFKGKRLPGNTNLVIAWGDNVEVPDFPGVGADGFGGPRFGRTSRNVSGKRVVATTEAGVTLQTENFRDFYLPDFVSTTPRRPGVGHLLLHEIGHAFGLDHSVGTDEMMFGGAWTPDADGVYRSLLAQGDLTGLKKMGLGQGCLTPLRGGRLIELEAPAPLS